MTIKNAIESYLAHCEFEKNLSQKSLQAYRTDLRQFLQFTMQKSLKRIADVDRTILRDFYTTLTSFQPRTMRRKMTCLKALFNYLEFDDLIATNPFRKMRIKYNTPKYLPTVLNKTEVNSILTAVFQQKHAIENRSSGLYAAITRDLAILEMLFATGIRVSELCNLRDNDIDVTSGSITILGKGQKERIVQIVDAEVKSVISEYRKIFKSAIDDQGFFFINRLNRQISSQSVRYMIEKYVRIAGVEKRVTPHTFRHTFATLLLEADVDIKYIQHFLGHSSIMTTQIYTHVNNEKQQQILRSKHPRLSFRLAE